MTSLPALTGKKLIAALKRSGFVVARIHGSHHFLLHGDGRRTVFQCMLAKPLAQACLPKFCGIAS